MSKLTLLEIVQDVLSDMNDDEVNSIADTAESLQVAQIAKSCFYELLDGRNWPHLHSLGQLDALADTTKPTHTKIPTNFVEIKCVEYDIKDSIDGRVDWRQLHYLSPDAFLRHSNGYDSTASTSLVVEDYSGAEIIVRNDQDPTYWTSFDDQYIVFNSYDVSVDDTIQNSKSRIYGVVSPQWSMTDSYIPELPNEMFSAYLAEVKSCCFSRLKQITDVKSEQQARRGKARMSQKAFTAHNPPLKVNRGRRRVR